MPSVVPAYILPSAASSMVLTTYPGRRLLWFRKLINVFFLGLKQDNPLNVPIHIRPLLSSTIELIQSLGSLSTLQSSFSLRVDS